MSSRSANEILLEQECDRLKAEIDRHVRIYEQALQETKAELDAAEKRWQSLALIGREALEADCAELSSLRKDAARLDCRTIRLMTHNEATGAWEPMVFEDVDLREAIDAAMKGGANG